MPLFRVKFSLEVQPVMYEDLTPQLVRQVCDFSYEGLTSSVDSRSLLDTEFFDEVRLTRELLGVLKLVDDKLAAGGLLQC